jgi:transcriptional regulator with XRE-family HTH domain
MLPFAALPTTECVRNACANVIRDIERDHDLTDQQLAEAIGVHVNTIARARNKQVTIDNLTLARIAAVFGREALAPWDALGMGAQSDDNADPMHALAMAIAALNAFIGAVEPERLRVVK